jgi:hypothetical protein
MLIAEDLLLLLTNDSTGKTTVDSSRLPVGLAGAVLLELALARRVGITGPGEPVKPGRLVVRDGSPTGDPLLDAALRRIHAAGPKKAGSALQTLGKGLREELFGRLVARGILRFEEGRVLGIFPTRSWPAEDVEHESRVRAGLRDVLVVGRTPSDREVGLVALLSALDKVPDVVGPVDVPRRELKRRAKVIAEGSMAGDAVRTAIDEINAAMTAVFIAVTAAGTAGASS